MKKKLIYVLLLTNLAVICWFWWRANSPFPAPEFALNLIALGRLTGLLAVYAVLLQFLMMGRARWLESIFGLDTLARWHRLNGFLTLTLIFLHPLFLVWGYAAQSRINWLNEFLTLLQTEDVLHAFIALLLFVAVVFCSIYIVRKRLKYEWWYAVHLLTYLAIVLAWGHQLQVGEDFAGNLPFVIYWYALYVFVFGNVLMFRFGLPLYRFWYHRFQVAQVTAESDVATSVYIAGQQLHRFPIQPGQFLTVRFLTPQLWWEAHPFSLSALPSHKTLRITAKHVGDFTKQLSNLKPGTPVLIEGPFGVFTVPQENNSKFLLIAAGIGITPIRSLTEQLVKAGQDVIVLYSSTRQEQTVFKKELDGLARQYHFKLIYIMTQQPNIKGETGRLNTAKLKRLIHDLTERQIYMCGPIIMMDHTKKMLLELGVSSAQVHFEQFRF